MFEQWINVAQQQSLQKITEEAQANIQSYAKHPTGRLASKFSTNIVSDAFPIIEGHIINIAPYALRREYGFSGEDGLGRHYNDAGLHYATDAFNDNYEWIREKYEWALDKALGTLTGSGD